MTGYVLGKRENREYIQKVIGANRGVVYAIRPGISEGQIPTGEVLTSLLNATARRYGVEARDLYSPAQIAEELVKEVMDSSFISCVQKGEYCARLAALGNAAKPAIAEGVVEAVAPAGIAEYRQRLVSATSMLLGILAAMMTVVYSFLEVIRSKRLDGKFLGDFDGKKWDQFAPVLATLLTMSATVLIYVLYRDLIRRRRDTAEMRILLEMQAERMKRMATVTPQHRANQE